MDQEWIYLDVELPDCDKESCNTECSTPDYLYVPRTEWIVIEDDDEVVDLTYLRKVKRWSWRPKKD